jgi:two-component system response regulator HupR/HoxA
MDLDYRGFVVLFVDDEREILRAVEYAYGEDFIVLTADSGPQALELLGQHDAAVIVADQRMAPMTGTEFLERSIGIRPDAIRIVLTGYADMDATVRAINASRIYQYVSKPWHTQELRLTLRRAVEAFHLHRTNARLMDDLRRANERLGTENAYLRETFVGNTEIVGSSAAMRQVLALVARVARSRSTVLVEGETGTGKELVARAIHAASPRRERLFVPVNCAAIAEGVLESELFGHRRGAFTGAVGDRKGVFEVADGGTVLLDEVSEASGAVQSQLLRVIQYGEIRPVGEARPRHVDVRVIAATNRRLAEEVAAGRFREDLYYRLGVFPIRVPPLRERPEDIPALVEHLVARIARDVGKPVRGATPEAVELLTRYAFPGNVRELENEIERAILLADPETSLGAELLSDRVLLGTAVGRPPSRLEVEVDEFERARIRTALARAHDSKPQAAEELGLTYRGLVKKMRRLGM